MVVANEEKRVVINVTMPRGIKVEVIVREIDAEEDVKSPMASADKTSEESMPADTLALALPPPILLPSVPDHVVVCVSTASSVPDYTYEQQYFLTGDVRWSGTRAGLEKVGDRFAFINKSVDRMELFTIMKIYSEPDDVTSLSRPHWGRWPRVLIMSAKQGEIPFSAMAEVYDGMYKTSPQSIARWNWCAELERLIQWAS
jgi:hypothetical protein